VVSRTKPGGYDDLTFVLKSTTFAFLAALFFLRSSQINFRS